MAEHDVQHNVNGHEPGHDHHPEYGLEEIVDAVKTFVRDIGDTITGSEHHSGSKPASRRESVNDHQERRASVPDKGHHEESHESHHEEVTTHSGSRRESLAKGHHEDSHGSHHEEVVTDHAGSRRESLAKGHHESNHESHHEEIITGNSGSRRESLVKEHPASRRSSRVDETTHVRNDDQPAAANEHGIVESAYIAARDGINDIVEAVETFVRDATGSSDDHTNAEHHAPSEDVVGVSTDHAHDEHHASQERRRSSVADGYSGHAQAPETETQVRSDHEMTFDVKDDGQIAWNKETAEQLHHTVELGQEDAFVVHGNGRIEWPQYDERVGDSLHGIEAIMASATLASEPAPDNHIPEKYITERRRSSVADGYHGQGSLTEPDSGMAMPPPLMEPPLAVGCPADMFIGRTVEEYRPPGFHQEFHQPWYRETNVRDDVDEKHCAICSEVINDDRHLALHDKHFHRNCFDSVYSGTCCACNKHIHLTEESVSVGALQRDWHVDCFKCHLCQNRITGSFQLPNDGPMCDNCYRDKFAPHCAACNGYIEGDKLKAMSMYYHPSCFVCAVCGDALYTMGTGMEYFNVEGKPYCRKDVEEAHIQVM
ncbi:LIM domain-containing protein A-like [Paramacrobiotus metropolitanus]|uniref:LIM domain-containing protein A-like n=1 Tax=Paramacrobiotus metropolitanus TaxID=2943436 RepID=UPI0024460D37|nr:LIM domain-containing protein A-like [Paramacrobiotus metropolitanus]XP_055331037.1 LIM domain-containing protein A-like [Paramacrobiotus metropolitanus]XP_055331038.1 LIM domain-containing protein A-like [Paramacrobiotus metropolitanus]XP_055331039.1 LIM domain-containing protein A-like [Paramacrobiotus metropolitanus]